ncbi:uncharacterized protein N7529_009563 [Penicillium soppii]|uniref:uncharacterized protein n=1 Tax=Penicillium soppii TaxID=69789 RepID=UPI0025468338|nr:uncharacterized protein N7529_009563 [Penicillium soppii]KAJ5855619.1 hypothetical protein N7529_009563 [Penicillium soppii]
MEFDHFINLCGQSVFAEEYRGDLDTAWKLLQEQPTNLPVGPEYAQLLRCKTIYAILTGNLKNAYENLHILYGILDQIPQEWGLRYTNYLLMADWTRRYPPSLRFYHERGLPRNVSMVGDLLGPDDLTQKFLTNFNQYLPTSILRDQVFCYILNTVQLAVPHLTRHLTSVYHPLSPGSSYHQPVADPAPFIAEMTKSVVKFQGIAIENGATSIALYLDRLLVEFYLTCQRPSAVMDLQGLYSRYEASGDRVGMANCKVMEGDGLVSPPFASPLSLNMIITDASSAIAEDTAWDPVEVDLIFDYSAQARQCYEDALDLFQEANCKRGQAAVLLRQGCCLHTAARHQQTKKGIDTDILDSAEEKLKLAIDLFGKDEANVQLVKAHQILVSISRGTHTNITAREIGLWCAGAKNEQLGHFIGLLLSRYGRQEWFRFSRMNTALSAWDSAYEVSDALDDAVPKFQATVSRAWVHHELFNSTGARVYLADAIAMVDQVSEHYETKIQAAPDTPIGKMDRTSLQIAKFNTLWTFSRKVSSIYLRVEDLAAFEKWQEKLVYWIQHDDSFREFRERLQQSHDSGSTRSEVFYNPKKKKYLWQKTMADDEVNVRSAAAEITYHRYLEEGNVDKAEDTLRLFVDQAGNMPKVYTRDLRRILACKRIGDLTKAREILDTIDDNSLFNDCLEDFQQGIGVRSAFPTIAGNALNFTVFGGDYERACRIVDLIIEISPTFFDQLNENSLDHSFRLSYYSAIMMHNHRPEVAFSRLIQVQRAIELRRTQIADVDARIGSSWAGWTCEVFINLATLCLSCRSANIPVGIIASYDHGHAAGVSWAEHALLFSERSRARAVLESLQVQADHGQSVDSRTTFLLEVVYKRRTLRTLLSLQNRSPEQEEEILRLEQDIKSQESEELSSTTIFIENSNTIIHPQLLYQCIDENAVVIEATFGPQGCIVFAVTREGIQQLHQGSTRNVDIRRPVMKIMQIMKEMTGYHGEEEQARKKQINILSRSISAELLDPFTETIKSKTHIIFSVSDPLTAFPFSVLQFDNEPLIKHAAISQAPSLTILHYLSQRKATQGTPKVSVFAKSPTKESSNTNRSNKEANLHMAGIEAINIARLFSTWPIEASHLTRQAFRKHVEGDSLILHIGTHGDINHRNPLLSSISIGQGQDFRVLDMSAIHSKVSLLVFAACLSGLGKATTGNEVLGFSHVVLSTGCQAYIGTLWKVSDFGSMLIMTLFYRLLKDEVHLSVAEVLRRAQLELIGLDSEKVGLLLDGMLENWTAPGDQGRSPAEFVPDAQFLLLTTKMILGQLDWTSPFYWAPFTLMGYGDFRFLPAST